MSTKTTIATIEELASNILKKEFVDDQAYIKIDAINFNFINDKTQYNVTLRLGINGKHTSFEVGVLIGVADNIFDFEEREMFAFAVYISNIAVNVYNSNNGNQNEFAIEDDSSTKYSC